MIEYPLYFITGLITGIVARIFVDKFIKQRKEKSLQKLEIYRKKLEEMIKKKDMGENNIS